MIIDDRDISELVERAPLISDLTPKDQQEWLDCMGKSLNRWCDAEDFTIMGQAQILYTVWSMWDERHNEYGMSLSREATGRWDYDFYTWAKSYSKRRMLREPAEQTIDQKIATYRDWSSGSILIPAEVFIPKRDNKGQIISTDDESTWEKVDFDWKLCDYGKLFISKSYAKKSMMTPDAWTALRDPYATVSELKEALDGQGTKKHHNPDTFRTWERDGEIYASEEDRTVLIATINFGENDNDPLFKRGVSHLLKASGCKVPLEYSE